jgi:hypothetical protein
MKLYYLFIFGISFSIFSFVFTTGRNVDRIFYKEVKEELQLTNNAELDKPEKITTVLYSKHKAVITSTGQFSSSYLFNPVVSAIKTVDKSSAEPGETLTYTIVISNTGTNDAENLSFTDNIDINTTLVGGSLKTSPIAVNDQYSCIGNVGIVVPAANGILFNDYKGINNPAELTAITDASTTGGGSISISADGGFSYTPAAGFTGDDTYDYTLTNDAGSSTGTITISIANIIWFVNNNYAGALEDGRIGSPFKSIANFQTINDGTSLHPGVNHNIFIYESSTNYSGNISLLNGQKLIGQDATTNLPAIMGFTTPTYSSPALPALNSGNATKVILTATGSVNVVTLLGGNEGNYNVRGLTINNKVDGSGINGTNFGTLNVSETSITGTGQALNLNTGTVNATFDNISSSSGTNALSLTTIGGTIQISAGAISGNTANAFQASGGTGSVSYAGTISKTSAGAAVSISNKTGGTISFTGGITSSGTNSGISLLNNTGATMSFTGGINLNTGTNAAFTATGGGTVVVTQNNTTIINTLVSTTGVGLKIENTTIGAGGLTFRSISVNGANKGISLNNTGSGGLTVTGVSTTASSGGVIQNIEARGIEIIGAQNINLSNITLTNANTVDGGFVGVCDELNNTGCNAAVYVQNTSSVNLTQVNVTTTEEQGINLNNVTGFTLSNSTIQGNGNNTEEGALKAFDLKGYCSITNSTFKNSAYRIAHIRNSSGNVQLSISNSSFINEASNLSLIKQDCFQMRTTSNATATVLISGSTFKRAGTKGIQFYAENTSNVDLAITNCTVDREGTLMGGIEVGSDHTATLDVNVDGNPLVTANSEVALNITSTGTPSTTNATGRNNIIKGGDNPNLNNFAAVRIFTPQQGIQNSLVTDNTITELDSYGIQTVTSNNSGSGTSTLNATLKKNNVTGTKPENSAGIRVQASTGITTVNCTQIGGSSGDGNSVTVALGTNHLSIAAASAQSTLRLTGTGNSALQIWTGNNNSPANPVIAENAVPGATIVYGGTPCPTPTNTTLPTITPPLIIAQNDFVEEEKSIEATEDVKLEEEVILIKKRSSGYSNDNFIQSEVNAFEEQNEITATDDISVTGIHLPVNKSLTIKFQVIVNNPFPANICTVNNQGTVTGDNFTTLQTDNDNNNANGINATATTVNKAPTITTCQTDIVTGTDNDVCTATKSFSVTAEGCPAPTVTYKITNTNTIITSPYSFPAGVTSVDVIASNGIGTDATCTFTVTVTNTAPAVASVEVPANGLYNASDNLDFTVNFNEAVSVNTAGGTPYIQLTIGTTNRNASYISGSGTTSLTFRYTLLSSDEDDNNGIEIGSSISLNGGTIQNVCGTNSNNTLNNVGSTTGVLVDNTAPVVISINRHDPATQGTTSLTLIYQVTFSETVSGVDVNDFVLTNVNGNAGTLTITNVASVSGSVYDVTASVTLINGAEVRLDLKSTGTGIRDIAGNDISSGFTNGESYILGVPAEITSCENISANTDAGTCTATKSFSVTVTGSPAPTVVYKIGNTVITSPYTFPVGTTTVNVSASNGIGDPATCSFTVTVSDNISPVVSAVTATPNVLWPPDRKMRDIALTYTATDNCGCTPVVTVTSNEAIHGTGDGDKGPDWEIISPTFIKLRAERGNGKDARVYTIRVTCTDVSGNTDFKETEVRIAHNITAPITGTSFKIGSTVNFNGVFWDKPGNKHTGQWLIDGSTVKGSVTEPSGTKNGKVTGSYKFSSAGVYKLQMNVTDQNKVTSYANTNEDMEAIVVIYDPNGGFTYGGGWFTSPAGALTSDPAATGKGNFGFTVNYYKNATFPKGETQFEFKVGDFEYNALNYEYLSISGAKAQIRGSGKITGVQSGINFIMTVIDGNLIGGGATDKIRLKIFNKNTNYVYYDNEPGISDADDPTTSVGLNSQIVISGASTKPAKTVSAPTGENDLKESQSLNVFGYPNPTSNQFSLTTNSSVDRPIQITITDVLGRIVEARAGVAANGTIKFGHNYRPGVYFVQVIQGTEKVILKLIKQ